MAAPGFDLELNLHRSQQRIGSLRMRMEAWVEVGMPKKLPKKTVDSERPSHGRQQISQRRRNSKPVHFLRIYDADHWEAPVGCEKSTSGF